MSSDRARNVTNSWFTFSLNPFIKTEFTHSYDPPSSISGKRCHMRVSCLNVVDQSTTPLTISNTTLQGNSLTLGVTEGLVFPYSTINSGQYSNTNKSVQIATMNLVPPTLVMSPNVLVVVPDGPTSITFRPSMTYDITANNDKTFQFVICLEFQPIE